MNKAKSTIDIAKECYILTAHGWLFCKEIDLDNFRQACIADYVSRCELKAYISNCENFIEYRKGALTELSFKDSEIHGLFTIPNDGE